MDTFTDRLMEWFEQNRRDFSWRRTKEPYRVLVAEMMLQKTTTKQVEGVYDKFISKFPGPHALSRSPLRRVEVAIRPLGMEHLRARRLKRLASYLTANCGGRVPDSAEKLMGLPGVGRYIANGVRCFAFGHDVPMVDTNIVRVLQRVFGITSSKARPRTDDTVWEFVGKLIPSGKGREVNLALLDFGGLVCTARKPKCPVCPMREICEAYKKVFSKQVREESPISLPSTYCI